MRATSRARAGGKGEGEPRARNAYAEFKIAFFPPEIKD